MVQRIHSLTSMLVTRICVGDPRGFTFRKYTFSLIPMRQYICYFKEKLVKGGVGVAGTLSDFKAGYSSSSLGVPEVLIYLNLFSLISIRYFIYQFQEE